LETIITIRHHTERKGTIPRRCPWIFANQMKRPGGSGAKGSEMHPVQVQLEIVRPITQEPEPHSPLETVKRISTTACLMLLACLAGYVPGWLAARGYEFEINDLRRQTRLNSLRTSLAEAALNTNRGEFEEARRNSSDFFTSLQAELDREEPWVDPKNRSKLNHILSKRDEVITHLARGDKNMATLLSAWYLATDDLLQ
jgi:hypothetical protein